MSPDAKGRGSNQRSIERNKKGTNGQEMPAHLVISASEPRTSLSSLPAADQE